MNSIEEKQLVKQIATSLKESIDRLKEDIFWIMFSQSYIEMQIDIIIANCMLDERFSKIHSNLKEYLSKNDNGEYCSNFERIGRLEKITKIGRYDFNIQDFRKMNQLRNQCCHAIVRCAMTLSGQLAFQLCTKNGPEINLKALKNTFEEVCENVKNDIGGLSNHLWPQSLENF